MLQRCLPFAPWCFALWLLLACPAPLHAGLFGESQEEKEAKVAKHVADVLREPNRLIGQAQTAAELGDTEEAIRLFRQAQSLIEKVEETEDTSGMAYATLRLKKFHCISSLDALALKRAEVQDNRQAVSDTAELEARLAQERAAIAEAEEKERAQQVPDHPPTLSDQLRVEQQRVVAAQVALQREREGLAQAQGELDRAAAAFTEAAKVYAAADAELLLATQQKVQAENPNAPGGDTARASAQAAEAAAKAKAESARQALEEARSEREKAALRKQTAEGALQQAAAALEACQRNVGVLERAIAQEQAEAEARAKAEQQRLEAEALARKQAQAEEIARLRKAQEQLKAEADAKARAAAEADAKARAHAVTICTELWQNKLVDRLEARLSEALTQWPDEEALLLLLARLRLVQGRAEDALDLVEGLSPKGATGRGARQVAAGVYLTLNRPMEAMKVLEGLMREDPSDPAACFNMAAVMLRLPAIDPKRELAAKYYARSVQLGGRRSAMLEQRLEME